MTAFDSYLAAPTPEFAFAPDGAGFRMVSQIWQGIQWHHEVLVIEPETKISNVVILEITGGPANPVDIERCTILADESGLRVAILFEIPNQPLWEMVEDDLIAYTFDQFLISGDPTWPLLFPMVKSAIRAMDGLQSELSDANEFIVTGSSKRGWTAWLTSLSRDPRVVGIAPRVIDTLNFPAQLAQQRQQWGGYSPMIQPYIDRDLHTRIATPRGRELVQMVDPYAYLDRLQVPVLIVNATNDPYWTVNALDNYWDAIPGEKYILPLVNQGHWGGDPAINEPGFAAFCTSVASQEKLPEITWRCIANEIHLITTATPDKVTAYFAQSETNQFSQSEWLQEDLTNPNWTFPDSKIPTAAFISAQFGQTIIATQVFLRDHNSTGC